MPIGDIVANLSINNKAWAAGLTQAQSQQRSFVSAAVSGFAPIGAALAGVWGGNASVAAFSESLMQSRKLNAVLAATGGAAGLTGVQISDYAAELQKVTNFEDDATVGAAAMLASFTNIRGDVFKDAILGAMDITTLMGGDLQSNIKMIGVALNDPIEGISKLSKAKIQFTESEKASIETMQKSGDLLGAQGVILDKVGGKFGGAAKATADPLKQLENTIGDVAENIGSALLPALSVGADAFRGLLGVVVGGAEDFKNFGIETAVILSHLGDLVKLTTIQWNIAFMEFMPQGEMVFETIGATIIATMDAGLGAAGVFGENFIGGLIEIKNVGSAVFQSIWASIKALATGKNPFTALTETWNKTLAEQMGPKVSKGLAEAFTEQYSQTFNNAMEGFADGGGALAGLRKEQEALSESLGGSMEKQRATLQEKFSATKVIPGGGVVPEFEDLAEAEKAKKEKKKPEDKTTFTAAFSGSQEAASIMLRGVGAKGGNEAQQIANRQLMVQQQLLAATKANKPPLTQTAVV